MNLLDLGINFLVNFEMIFLMTDANESLVTIHATKPQINFFIKTEKAPQFPGQNFAVVNVQIVDLHPEIFPVRVRVRFFEVRGSCKK